MYFDKAIKNQKENKEKNVKENKNKLLKGVVSGKKKEIFLSKLDINELNLSYLQGTFGSKEKSIFLVARCC